MPNFWTTTSQKIYEVLYGPRTRDVEFDEKADELTQTIQAVKKIQEVIHTFHSKTEGIQKLAGEIYTSLPVAYSPEVIYYEFIKDVCAAHKSLESSYISCAETIDSLTQLASEWDKLFGEVNQHLRQREENRQVYDHYDEKMEKLVRSRNDKLGRHHNESQREIEKFERNDGKYKRAANDLIQSSNYTYKLIQDLLDYRYKLLNHLVSAFVSQEKKFIDSCVEFFRKFDNLSAKMSGLDIAFKPSRIAYDPTKHIRATRLLVGVNINELPQIVKKDKYGYEDYKKKIADANCNNNQGGYGCGGNLDEYKKIMNMDKQGSATIQNPFSYEAYKAKTSSNAGSKDQVQKPFNSNINNSNGSTGFQPKQEYIPNQQWNLKLSNTNDNSNANEGKNNEEVKVFNPYSTICLNSQNSNPMEMNKVNNPPNAFQNPYQSHMPIHSKNDFPQFGSNNNGNMNYSNLLQRPKTFTPPSDFPK